MQPAHPAVPKQYTAQAAGQISGTCAVATVKGAPSEPFKREYLTAVKAYEQQVGANIVRGKMFIESLPTNRTVSATGMLPGMVPGTALPGIESSNNMEMGMGTGGPCGYSQHMTMGGGFGASPVGVQRSRDDFREMMNSGGGVDFAKLAEMGPQVRRLLDMGSQIDQIMDMTRMAEGSPIPMGLDSTAGRVGGPATGFGGPPPLMSDGGFDLPMRDRYCGSMMPPYGAPTPGMASAYSAERFQGGYGRPGMDPPMSGSAAWPRDGPRGRRTTSRENVRPPMNDFTEESRFSPKHSMSRASDLLQKIKEDIDAHRAETVLQKIRRDVITMDTDNDIGRVATARRNSLPPERGKKSSRTHRRPHDDWDYEERKSPRPRRGTSRHHKSSSLSSSSSSSSSSRGNPRKNRSHKYKDGKSKRRKAKGKKRRGSAKNDSSSSSSSSSSPGRISPRNKGGRSVEFVRKVTERFSSESPDDEDPAATVDDFNQQYLLIARPVSLVATNEPGVRRSGCPVLNALGVGSREKTAIRTQSKAFGGSLFKCGTDGRPPSSMSAGGVLYRYESKPTGLKRE